MLRAVKGDDELERLAAAGAAADASLEEIVGVRFAGRTEREIAADLAGLLRRHGHSQVDFTVVGSGPNGANPHHEMSERTIQEGDMVVLDFGGLKDGYGSDTTRTVHVGPPTPRSARSTRSSAGPNRRPSRRYGPGSPARRSTAPRARSSPTRATASTSFTASATASG